MNCCSDLSNGVDKICYICREYNLEELRERKKQLRKKKCLQTPGVTWCECGGYYGLNTKYSAHKKSKRHINFNDKDKYDFTSMLTSYNS